MRNRHITWSAAIEDASGAAEVLAAPVAEFEINVNEVDEDGAPLESVDAAGNPTVDVTMPETEDALDEVEEAEAVVEKMEETSEVLESYAVAIEQRIRANGGLTASEWELVQIGLKSRIKHIEALTPSKESFSHSRLTASTEALDAIKQGIQSVWEAIKAAIMAVVNRVRKWFIGALSDSARLAKRAKAIKEKAKKTSSVLKDKDTEVRLPVKSLIGSDGKPMKPEKYVAAAHFYARVADQLVVTDASSKNDIIEKKIADVEKWISEATANPTNYKQSLNEYIDNLPMGVNNTTITTNGLKQNDRTEPVDGLNFSIKEVTDLPGNSKFEIRTMDDDVGSAAVDTAAKVRQYIRIGYDFGFKPQKADLKDLDNDIEFPVLGKDQVETIATAIEDMCNHITKYKKDFEKRNQIVDGMIKRLDRKMKEVGRDPNVKDNATLSSFLNAVVQGTADHTKDSLSRTSALVQELLTRSKALLNYGARSLAMYE